MRGRTWVFNEAEEARANAPREREGRQLTRLQMRALDEMLLAHTATPDEVRAQYGLLIKRYHPDSNGGDRSMEQRLTIVIRAFRALKSAGLA
jgi:hypothetical protein